MRWEAAEFELSAGISSQLPHSSLPEFAFSGRSNVGKSSLINRLLGRKALARTSATPGKTATSISTVCRSCGLWILPAMAMPGYRQ